MTAANEGPPQGGLFRRNAGAAAEYGAVRIGIVLVVVVLLALALGGSTLMSRAEDARDAVTSLVPESDGRGQSPAQLSPTEYVRLRQGTTRAAVRALAGEPDTKRAARVEGLEIDCWYYGIVGATGTFQLCFADGKLATRARFDAARRP